MMKTFCVRNWKEFVSETTSWKWSILFFPCKIQLLSKTFLSLLNLICLEFNMFLQIFDLFRLLCNHKGVTSSSGFLIISVLILMILIIYSTISISKKYRYHGFLLDVPLYHSYLLCQGNFRNVYNVIVLG